MPPPTADKWLQMLTNSDDLSEGQRCWIIFSYHIAENKRIRAEVKNSCVLRQSSFKLQFQWKQAPALRHCASHSGHELQAHILIVWSFVLKKPNLLLTSGCTSLASLWASLLMGRPGAAPRSAGVGQTLHILQSDLKGPNRGKRDAFILQLRELTESGEWKVQRRRCHLSSAPSSSTQATIFPSQPGMMAPSWNTCTQEQQRTAFYFTISLSIFF